MLGAMARLVIFLGQEVGNVGDFHLLHVLHAVVDSLSMVFESLQNLCALSEIVKILLLASKLSMVGQPDLSFGECIGGPTHEHRKFLSSCPSSILDTEQRGPRSEEACGVARET